MPCAASLPLSLCLLLAALSSSCEALSATEAREEALLKFLTGKLTSNSTKSKLNAPLVKNRKQTIELNFYLETFYGLDEKEVLKLSFWMSVLWVDEALDWRRTEWANITEVPMDTSKMWVPDVSIWNCDEPWCTDISLMKVKRADVKRNGLIKMSYRIVPKVPCPINTDFFPFDIQRCKIEVGSFTSKISVFNLAIDKVVFRNKASVGEWELLKIEQRSKCPDSVYKTYPCTQLFVHTQRKSKFYVSFVFVPCLLISSIQVVVFITNRKIHRVAVGLAIIMAVTMSVLLSSQSAPKSMVSVPLMGAYLIIQMFLIIGFTVVALISLARKEANEEPSKPPSSGTSSAAAAAAGKSKPLFSTSDTVCLSVYVFLTFLNALTCMTFIPSGISIRPINS